MLKFKQPTLCPDVSHDRTGGENMPDFEAGIGQGTANKETPVAFKRIGLRAHHRHTVLSRFIDEGRQSPAKFR